MLAAWGGALPARAASPISSEFTYQGRLSQAGEPCTGAYDLQFALYDASEGGNAVGQTLLLTNVSVTDGLFTAVLDFGPEVFDGEARWLEISVRAGDSPEAVILSPRQALMPKPYAIHAANAATALVAASAESVAAGAIQAEALAPGAVVSNTLAAGAVSAAHLSPSLLSTLTDTPYLRATDFGAAGDGVTDDTAALQAALNAMAARQRALYIPAGKYKLTGKLTVPAPDYLGPTATLRGTGHFRVFGDGPGTQLEWATLSKGVGMTFANYQQGLTLEGLKFLGPLLTDWDEDNSSRAISAGLSATTSSGQNIRIKDCAFLGWDTACVLSNYWGVFYEGNTFTSNRVAAVVNACNHGVEMRNNNISGSFIPGDQLCGAGIVYVKDWFGDAIGWISGDQAIHANNIIYGCVTGVWNADLTLAVDGDHYGSCGVFGLITERGAATTYRGVYTLDQIPVMTNGWAAQFEMTSEAAANVSWIGCWPTGWRRLYNVVGTNYVAPPAFEQTLYGLFNGTNAVKSVPWRDVIRWNNVGNLGFSSEPELYWVLNTPSMRVNQLGLGTNGAQIHSTYPDSSTALFLGYDSRPFQIRGWTPDLGTPSVASILPRSGDWSLTPIWRDGGPHSALTVDAFSTNSGAAAGSTLLDLKSNGISKFSVSQDGAITWNGETRTAWPGHGGGISVAVSGPGLSASTNNDLVTITAGTNTSLALNARDFGAVGDGVADDTAALQAALDAMVERSAMLQVPPGDYKLTGKLTIPPALDAGPHATEWRTGGFTVRGAGLATRFYWPELDSGVGMDFAYGHHGLTIEGIQFIGPLMANWDTNNHSQAISTGNPNWSYTGQDIRIKDCIFIGWETACVLSNYWNVYYAGNRFSSNRLGAIYSAGCHVVEVRNNTIQGSYNPEDSPCETGVSYVMTDYGSGPISGDTAIHFNNRITGCVTGVWNADLVLTVQGDFYQDCGVYGAITAKGAATAYQGLYSLDQQPSLTIGQPAQFYLTSEAAPTVSFLGCWLTDRRPVFNVVGNDYASPVVLDQSYTGLFNGIHPRVAELPIRSTNVPSHMNAPGEQGQIAWDGNYVYLCVGKDTWKRAALSSW